MRRGKQPQDVVELPENWWPRLRALCNVKWRHEGAHIDIYELIQTNGGPSKRSLVSAKSSNLMTDQLFARLIDAVGYETREDLLHVLGAKKQASRLATPIPTSLTLTTQKTNPQWADFRDYKVEAARPWALRCQIATESPYFRFGFKLLSDDGRVFGDGSIKSHDANLIVHIGRNNWDRPRLRITAQDIFMTAYMSGNFVEDDDRPLFRSEAKLVTRIELKVDKSYCASLTVNGHRVFRHVVPPELCRRVAVYAWGDREEFQVDVTELAVGECGA